MLRVKRDCLVAIAMTEGFDCAATLLGIKIAIIKMRVFFRLIIMTTTSEEVWQSLKELIEAQK